VGKHRRHHGEILIRGSTEQLENHGIVLELERLRCSSRFETVQRSFRLEVLQTSVADFMVAKSVHQKANDLLCSMATTFAELKMGFQ